MICSFLVFFCLWIIWLVVCWLFEMMITVMFCFPYSWMWDRPVYFWLAFYKIWAVSCRQACSMHSFGMLWSLFFFFFLKVNLEKSAAGGWNCRENVNSQWLSKPWRWAIQRSKDEISWEKQVLWGSSITPISSTWKASSQKVGTDCWELLSLNSDLWESWERKHCVAQVSSECFIYSQPPATPLAWTSTLCEGPGTDTQT